MGHCNGTIEEGGFWAEEVGYSITLRYLLVGTNAAVSAVILTSFLLIFVVIYNQVSLLFIYI